MDVHALRVFAEVVRSQGFTAAGRALHLTQPAISKAVKGLEQELGTPLLRREHRRIRLTDAGQVVLARAQGVLDALRVMEEEVEELSQVRRGRLRIGTPPIVGVAFLPRLLAEYHALHPGVALELREEGSHQIEELVRGHELDVGAVVLPTDEEAFGTLPFVRDQLRVVLHPRHPLAGRRAIALDELAEAPFVLYRPEFALHGHILEACRRRGFEPHVVSQSSHWDFIVAMVAADIGVALLPVTICRLLDRRQVRTVRLVEPTIPWDVALVWRKDDHHSPATRAWLELAGRRLSARRPGSRMSPSGPARRRGSTPSAPRTGEPARR